MSVVTRILVGTISDVVVIFKKYYNTNTIFVNMVQGEGFEPPKAEPSDLQSDVFDRFTIPANLEPTEGFEPTTRALQKRRSSH